MLCFEVLPPDSVKRLSLLGTVLIGVGISWIVYPFMGANIKVGFDWVFGPFITIFLGMFCCWIKPFLKGMATGFVFDLQAKELRITHQVPPSYDFIPSCFALSEIRVIHLIHLRETKSSIHASLELILKDKKFIPVSVFKDEAKAKRVAQEIATALQISIEESYRAAEPFQSSKRRFLEQFQDKG
jgi:hypothetical protein